MSGKLKTVMLVFSVIVVSAIVSFVSAVAFAGKGEKIFPGVTVSGVYLGDKTKDEAEKALADYENLLKNKVVTVNFDGGRGEFRFSGVDFRANTSSMLNKAWAAGREGSFLTQWQTRRRLAEKGYEIPFEFSVSKDKLKTVLEGLTKSVRTSPRDAKLVITSEEAIQVIESSNGQGIDINDAFDQLQSIIKDGEKPEIQLAFVDIKPSITTEDVNNMKVNGVLASFTTHFDPSKVNRTYNVKVAAAALDGLMIKPGDVFSFNKIVGPRSQEAGYKEAKTIINNEFVDALGGGVCQVSSTLYNALLQTDVGIVQRSPHSLVIKYVPLGQDAAVAYGYKDLQFKNNLTSAIIMKTSIRGNTLTIKLFADSSLRKTVNIVNSVVKVYPFKVVYKNDPTLPKGKQVVSQKGENGYRVTSKKMIYVNGKLVGQKQLSPSYYKPLDNIILVGTKVGSSKPTTSHKVYKYTPPATKPKVPGNTSTTPPNPVPPKNSLPGQNESPAPDQLQGTTGEPGLEPNAVNY